MRNLKAFEQLRGVFDAFDFEPDRVQRIEDFRQRCVGFEVVFEPGGRELHDLAPTPADRVGWSKGEKP